MIFRKSLAGGAVAVALLWTAGGLARGRFDVVKLPTPPWHRLGSGTASTRIRISVISSRPTQLTEDADWIARNGLDVPEDRVPSPLGREQPFHPLPGGTPASFRGARLVRAIRQPGTLLLVYGENFSEGHYLVARSRGRTRYALDFASYAYAPAGAAGERPFVYQSIEWAREAGGVLYVSHGHSTYARSSGGLNAYVTAIDLKTTKVLWRSSPLVSNSATFVLVGDAIVTGYGFSKEPDFLYVLDRRTGALAQRLALASAASYILPKGKLLYVRSYNDDVVVRVAGA